MNALSRSAALAIGLILLSAALSLTPVELAFSVEYRLLSPTGGFIYAAYSHGSVIWVNHPPLYIYMWRIAAQLFLIWIGLIVIYVVKPMKVADLTSIIIAAAFAASNYAYLASIGARLIILPLTYILYTVGSPVVSIDMGQVALIYAAWRAYKNGLFRIRRGD